VMADHAAESRLAHRIDVLAPVDDATAASITLAESFEAIFAVIGGLREAILRLADEIDTLKGH